MVVSLYKSFLKIPKIQLIFYVLLFLLFIIIISQLNLPTDKKRKGCQEGFTTEELAENLRTDMDDKENDGNTFFKEGNDVYDNFYAKIYDELLFSKVKNDFEIGEIKNHTMLTRESLVLDIGSGTGHHVNGLIANGINAIGVDKSAAMVAQAKKTYPQQDYRTADVLDAAIFPSSTFTHITCFYFTIYYIQDKKHFFENCLYWLKPGGYLVLHLVDRETFDPILPAGDPFKIISPQNYAKNRITSTVVNFDEFDYKSNFKVFPNDDTAVLGEVFKFKKSLDNNNGKRKLRRNEHKFYMPTQKKIINTSKEVGFIVLKEIHMVRCQYTNQYIYILQKPN
jgi:SAM-dependent methyltransferase